MDMGPEQPLAALRRDLGVGGADKKRRLRFVDAFGLREDMRANHRSEDNQRLAFDDAIHRVERVGAGCTGIFCRQDKLLASDSPSGIDFIDSEFDAVAGLDAEQRQIAGEGGSQTKRDR
jgi:hypothetical protein